MKKIIFIYVLAFIFLSSMCLAATINCPPKFDDDAEIKSVISKGIFHYLTISTEQEQFYLRNDSIFDLIDFYVGLKRDCVKQGLFSGKTILNLANIIDSSIGYINNSDYCYKDGITTPKNTCSYSFYCDNGVFVEDCSSRCQATGCEYGSCQNNGKCDYVLKSINSCGILNETATYYKLNASITTSGTCFNINASNILLDGNGYTITGDGVGNDYGIYANNVNGIAVKNFGNITYFEYGVYFASVNYSSVQDLTADSNKNGGVMLSSSSNYNVLTDISVSNGLYGVGISLSMYNNLTRLILNNNSHGILLSSSGSYNFFEDILSTNNKYGVSVQGSNNNAFVRVNCSFNEYGIGMAYFANNNSVRDSVFSNNLKHAIDITFAGYSQFTNIVANSNQYGIALSGSGSNKFTNIVTNSNKYGIYIGSASNNVFTNITSNLNSNYGIELSSSHNNQFLNSNLLNSNSIYDVSLTSSLNNSLLNVGYNPVKEYVSVGSLLIRKWYYQTQVTNNGVPANGVQVSVYDKNNVIVTALTTDSNGKTLLTELAEYVNNGVKTNSSPYRIVATKDAQTNTHTVKLDKNVLDMIDLSISFGSPVFEVTDALGQVIAVFDSNGNIQLKGTCSTSQSTAPQDSFVLDGGYVDNSGNLVLAADDCLGQDASCANPPAGSFAVFNGEMVVSYLDSSGELCVKGRIFENYLG